MLNFIWYIVIIYIFILSLKLTKQINFKNYKIFKMFKSINKTSLFLSLGTKMGVGTIVGTTMSIFIGGPGTVLWILVFSLITSSVVYTESYLGSKYKEKLKDTYISGPYFYTKKGLNKKVLATILLLLLVTTYSLFFLMIQTNTIYNILNINKFLLVLIIASFFIFTLTFSFKEIMNLINKIVPYVCLTFIIFSIYIIIKNNELIPSILKDIIFNAFTLRGISVGLIIGIKRSIFLTELLIGTTSVASGIDNDEAKNIINTQIIGFYFINFVICIFVSLIVLIYLKTNNLMFNNYNELLINVFTYHSKYGLLILQIFIIFLSSSAILSGFYIGISNITYLASNKKIISGFKIIMLLFGICGIFINTSTIWYLIDIMMVIQIILNLYAITKLKGEVK